MENSYKIAFYTCFYGSNNNPAFMIPKVPSFKYNCYYYTNNNIMIEKIKHTNWIGIYDDKSTNDDIIESAMVSKHIKAMPHKYEELQNYDYLCYLDSKLEKINEVFVENMINDFFIKQNYALLIREHWYIHNNVWNEYYECICEPRYFSESEKYKKYIQNQVNNGLSIITEHHCASGLLIRNNKHDKIIELNETWYKHIQECGIQDQISFFFVKQLFTPLYQSKITTIDDCNNYIHFFNENPFIHNDISNEYTLNYHEDKLNMKSVFHTASIFYICGKMEDAMKWYMIYTNMKDTWNEEIFESYIRISDCMRVLNYEEKYIVGYLNKSIALFRDRAEPFYKLGEYYYHIKLYDIAYVNFKICQHKRFENISHKYTIYLKPYTYGNNVDSILLECYSKIYG